jgi:hypothetical protein
MLPLLNFMTDSTIIMVLDWHRLYPDSVNMGLVIIIKMLNNYGILEDTDNWNNEVMLKD